MLRAWYSDVAEMEAARAAAEDLHSRRPCPFLWLPRTAITAGGGTLRCILWSKFVTGV